MCILGSREQMCVNPDVIKKETNAEKVHLCRSKVRSRTCGYHSNVDGTVFTTCTYIHFV